MRSIMSTAVVGAAMTAGLLAFATIATPATIATKPRATASVSFNGYMDYTTVSRVARPGVTVRITHSLGGLGSAVYALSRARKVVVDGTCYSACAWAFVMNRNSCFTPNARFAFHAASDPGLGRPMPRVTAYWLSKTRKGLRGRLAAVRHTMQLVHVPAVLMRRYYPDRICR